MILPEDFIARTKPLLNKDWDKFLEALQEEPPVSIRINTSKASGFHNVGEEVPWSSSGFYLDKRPQFTFDPLFHAGCYYVQEASSMFVGQAIRQYIDGDVKVLDLCAAPGGKSTLIADLISENSLLVSNEVIRSRANILAENMAKWGKPNVVVTNSDPSAFSKLNGFFDVLVVDAPCSGEGMFRKDPNAISEWSVNNVRLCQERQRRILADVWTSLKIGGILIYSTCTYNIEENEENVQWIRDELGADILPLNIQENWQISPSLMKGIPAYRFYPHKTKGEGFFLAVLRKTNEETDQSHPRKNKQDKDKKSKIDLPIEYKNYIKDKERFTFYQKGDAWYAFPSSLYDNLYLLRQHLNITSEGICLGEFKGKDFIPSQSLTLSNHLNNNTFPIYSLDWQTAISYLRKEAISLENQPKGYMLLIYNDIPLGFVKNIGNRANNIYPQEWRIRSSNIPQEEVNVLSRV